MSSLGDFREPNWPERAELAGRIIVLENELANERRHADRWQRLAGRYDDIRYALRNAPDTPEGHAEFYRECSGLIFPDASTESEAL
ncbi:hypothetical protein PJJ30_24065 [Mycobacterium kansasii]